MILDDAAYFTRRALWQIDRASEADDDGIAQVHVELSSLYLQRALSDAERALTKKPEPMMPLRIVA